MTKLIVKAEDTSNTVNPDITAGKKYEAFGASVRDDYISFFMLDDADDELFCLSKGCTHLGGANWTIVSGDPRKED